MRSPTASRTSSTKTACSARSTGSGDSPVLEEPELTCAKKTTRTPKTPGFRGLCAIGTPERESRSCAKTQGGGGDSNPRPPGPQPGALPTELPPPRGETGYPRVSGIRASPDGVKFPPALKSGRRSPDHLVMDEQRDQPNPLAKLDEELCGPRSAEDRKILRWRFRELRGLGLSHVEARMLAETGA